MNEPKVSILIPLYNSNEYIADTIDSCLNQTYENIEIIIIDDGSTDSGLSIARQYENNYPNVKVEAQKNSGAPVARNRAFELSTGVYIQYIDADDLLHLDKIKLQMEVLKNEDDKSVAFGKYGYFEEDIENIDWKDILVNKSYNSSKKFLLDLWESGNSVIPHMWLVPRKLIEESEGWDESLVKNQDGEFFARVVSSADKVLFVKNSIGYYRRDNKNSISRQVSKNALQASLQSFETYCELVKDDMDNPAVRRTLAYIYSKYLYNVYPVHKDLIEKTEEKLKYLGFNRPIIKYGQRYYYWSKIIGVYGVIRLRKLIGK